MNKPLLTLVLAGLAFSSCIDSDYDLTKLDTDDVTIGDDDSVFKIPLATVKINLDKITQGTVNIEKLFQDADLWLPNPLPDNADFVDIALLFQGGDKSIDYRQKLTTLFFSQLSTSDEKLENMTNAIYNTPKYLNSILPVISGLPSAPTPDQFEQAFKQLVRTQNPQVRDKVSEFIYDYLTEQLKIDPVSYTIDSVSLDDTIIDMLSENLDKEGYSLGIYGSVSSALPVSVVFRGATFSSTSVVFPKISIDSEQTGTIAETNITRDDLRSIVNGIEIHIPIELTRYYPGRTFDSGIKEQLVIELKMIKRGGLSFEL